MRLNEAINLARRRFNTVKVGISIGARAARFWEREHARFYRQWRERTLDGRGGSSHVEALTGANTFNNEIVCLQRQSLSKFACVCVVFERAREKEKARGDECHHGTVSIQVLQQASRVLNLLEVE